MISYLMVARGGSKGLLRKNLRTIAGRTLMAWKAASVRAADPSAVIHLSTEDPEIAEEGKRLGCEIIDRPPELASDTATSDSVILHALPHLIGEKCFLLEPSSPFTPPEDYTLALDIADAHSAALVLGMRHVYPHTSFVVEEDISSASKFCVSALIAADQRRQAFPPQVTANGSLYLFNVRSMATSGALYGSPNNSFPLVQDLWSSIEIEDANDLAFAEFAVEKGYVTWPAS